VEVYMLIACPSAFSKKEYSIKYKNVKKEWTSRTNRIR
jgi:hypothetical protein